ncbi:acetyl/propionyl/methylcrotonyl-CoA carboxylase subunit alpha [Pyruvatibacter mobilis]|uniref:acetyl/propionyl/methylcrotonyl-CoA carboxylase subunit alpha n=1 Tax=Pyruvatibacter mobilis TaxID=1712261 RepID=UPI003C7B7A8B
MITSLLIANRGEIACRVIETARAMGLRTIAVYSEADAGGRHVEMADEAHLLGPAPAAESYLRMDRILDVARASRADAIHPGYGFLSENAEFADACAEAGVVFVGPPADAIRAMGLKDTAKALMEKAGVPVVPGYHGDNQDAAYLAGEADQIGYPVLIKAVAGGGGKGMRRVDDAADFDKALQSARREAKAAFGDDRVLIEKFVASPRHIEVQVFADAHGNVVHLFERDCSVQRRHQKVVEEAPAPGMPDDMRAAMGHAACEAARAIGYRGAGTIEFIADASDGLRSDRFYFMEMNTRLQVEHPVTEMITGQDLVDWQLRVAGGEPLPLTQDDIGINGHALEVRLYAEDPAKSFFPSTGCLAAFRLPPESNAVRVDAGVREGDEISIYYDPMIAKLITWGDTRDNARRQMDAALRQVEVAGVRTNTSFLRRVIGHDVFAVGAMDTGFIDEHLDALVPAVAGAPDEVLLLGAIAVAQSRLAASQTGSASDPYSPWNDVSGWRLSGTAEEAIILVEGEESRELCVRYTQDGIEMSWSGRTASAAAAVDRAGPVHALIGGHGVTAGVVHASNAITVMREGESWTFALPDPLDVTGDDAAASGGVTAPMTGKITQVWVKAGDSVSRGAPLIALEAMKMEHTLSAPGDLKVSDVLAAVGDQVEGGAALVVFEDPAS